MIIKVLPICILYKLCTFIKVKMSTSNYDLCSKCEGMEAEGWAKAGMGNEENLLRIFIE